MSLASRSLALACAVGLLGPVPRRDLDVAIPPGSPLEWSASFPAYTPARHPLFPRSGAGTEAQDGKDGAEADPERSRATLARSEADVRFANAFGQVRILTWDLAAHLEWMQKPLPGPVTGSPGLRPRPTEFGDPLYWLALAPLLRLLLHPDSLSRSETLAHLVELGEPVLPVLASAAGERGLATAASELRALIPPDVAALPSPPSGATPREAMLARFVLEECLRDHPLDPSDDFGRRLFLFAEEAEPLLCTYAQHPSLALARNAVAALTRYETRTALQFLAGYAARATDPVALVRALSGLGRFRGPLDAGPLVERLRRTQEPVLRAALIGALGRLGARAAAPLLLELAEEARKAKDSDLLIQVLSALARISWIQPQPEQAKFCARIAGEARELAKSSPPGISPDLPDPASLRADLLTQLAWLARSQAAPGDEKVRAQVLGLAQPGPRDARLDERGVGGTDPLGNLAPPVRFLYLDGLARAGPAGLERLAALARRTELETALRGRALALLAYDQRDALAAAFLGAPSAQPEAVSTPVELRIQALEVLIGDAAPRLEELCRAQLAQPALAGPRPPAGELYLALRALRYLSESGRLTARDLVPLFAFVQRPLAARAALAERLRERVVAFVEAAGRGARKKELEAQAGELFDFVVANRLNALLDPGTRDGRVDALLEALGPPRQREAAAADSADTVRRLLAILLGGEVELPDPGRALFQPTVPLAEEVLLALGRTRDPLALELILTALEADAHELRGHAALAVGMCGEPRVAERLVPALLDEDPFVRFCASESLRHLTGRETTIDWMSAPAEERRAAAEEYRAWFLEKR